MSTWHNAFVFKDGYAYVYEIYKIDGEHLHTEDPVAVLPAEDPQDLAIGLSQFILDLGKGRYFESVQKMQQHYGMGGDDIE